MLPEVIYEDNHLLVLSKPSGMPTQPSGGEVFSLEEWGKEWLKKKYEKKGNVFLEAVHRIDKPVSGLVLFAKSSKGLSRMQETIRAGIFHKTYLALMEGHLEGKEGILEDRLIHDSFRARISEEGKHSQLTYRVVKEHEHTSLLEIKLITGRYHQIRIQFSSRGNPIVGDKKYGSKSSYPQEGIALHHFQLETRHPTTGKRLLFVAPPSQPCLCLSF
jgi:23S rRNA pseudouridine1911/1915/1917 synthase